MAEAIQITKFKANDGKVFKTEAAAKRHEELGQFREKYSEDVDAFVAHLKTQGEMHKLAEGRVRNVVTQYLGWLDGQQAA